MHIAPRAAHQPSSPLFVLAGPFRLQGLEYLVVVVLEQFSPKLAGDGIWLWQGGCCENERILVFLQTIFEIMHQPFRITHLEIQNIGPFGHLSLEFPEKPHGITGKAEVHILTGENGTGKTTILEALVKSIASYMPKDFAYKFRTLGNPPIEKPLGTEGAGEKSSHDASLNVSFSNAQHYSLSRNKDGSFGVSTENLFFHNYENQGPEAPISVAFFAYSGYRSLEHVEINGISELTGAPLSRSVDFKHSVNPELILNWIANTLTKEALAKSESNTTASARFRRAVEGIENTVSRIIEKNIRFSLGYDPLDVKVELDGTDLNFNTIPDGLKSIVSWIADLLMRMDRVRWEQDMPIFERNFILFLDEIEVHLHPTWQRKILPAIQELFPNAQIFVSTHSPFVVGSVDGAWIHKLEKPNGDSQLAVGYPKVSEDAKSFRLWLDEVFDIKAQFGEGVERDMNKFYELRNRILKGENGATPEKLLEVGRILAEQSSEVNQIVQFEIRQLNRLKGLELSI